MDSLTITLFRGLVGAVFSVASTLTNRRSTGLWGSPANRGMLLLRGFLGGVTIASAFFAVSVSACTRVRERRQRSPYVRPAPAASDRRRQSPA